MNAERKIHLRHVYLALNTYLSTSKSKCILKLGPNLKWRRFALVDFEIYPVQVQDFMKISYHLEESIEYTPIQ
jgi:hypothetical protein